MINKRNEETKQELLEMIYSVFLHIFRIQVQTWNLEYEIQNVIGLGKLILFGPVF